jgi:hypothetical protein
MSFQGRSPDDLPLAAYSTGVVDDEPDEEIVAEPSHPLSQQEAIALAMGIEPPANPERTANPEPQAKPEPEPAAARDGSARPRRSLSRRSLPGLALPAMPRLGFRGRTAAVAESPFHLEPPTMSMSVAHVPAARQVATPPAVPAGVPAAVPMPRSTGVPGRTWRRDLGDLGTRLRNPRTAVRDPRVLFGGMIAVGLVLLGVSLLGGGNAGGPGPGAAPSAAPGIVPAGPGPATVEVTGRIDRSFTLTGTAGFGKPADGQLASTWADATGTVLSLTGRVGSVTRTTSGDIVLSVTVMVDGAPVLFQSEDGECTVGMAETMSNVTGNFVCKELTSADRRMKLKITGTYQT